MAKQLYLHDTYLFESSATILAHKQDDKGPYLLLDQTIFYPQGGGQPSDQGLIQGTDLHLEITQVRQVDDEIRHYLLSEHPMPLSNQAVFLKINKERRLLNARYHTTAHLLANIIETTLPSLKAIKGHAFPKEAYVDFQGSAIPNLTQILTALEKAISNNLKVQTFEIDPAEFEAKFYKLPYPFPLNKTFRATQIGNYPPIPCGGTHLTQTQEIGKITPGKIKQKNDILRLPYELS